jgi:hypothetical protein
MRPLYAILQLLSKHLQMCHIQHDAQAAVVACRSFCGTAVVYVWKACSTACPTVSDFFTFTRFACVFCLAGACAQQVCGPHNQLGGGGKVHERLHR